MPQDGQSAVAARRPGPCKGCSGGVRIPPAEVERILKEYLTDHPQPLAGEEEYQRRLAACRQCDDLQYGTTCSHCGCLVAVRAKLANAACPRPGGANW